MSVRLGALVVVVLASVMFLGWTVAIQIDPYPHPASPVNTTVSIQIREFVWIVSGCAIPALTSTGGFLKAGSTVNETSELTNSNVTDSCRLTAVIVTPSAFQAEASNLPLVIGPASTAALKVSISLPAFAEPTNVTVSVVASFES